MRIPTQLEKNRRKDEESSQQRSMDVSKVLLKTKSISFSDPHLTQSHRSPPDTGCS
jgi:hypothetical protein